MYLSPVAYRTCSWVVTHEWVFQYLVLCNMWTCYVLHIVKSAHTSVTLFHIMDSTTPLHMHMVLPMLVCFLWRGGEFLYITRHKYIPKRGMWRNHTSTWNSIITTARWWSWLTKLTLHVPASSIKENFPNNFPVVLQKKRVEQVCVCVCVCVGGCVSVCWVLVGV